MVFDHLPDEVVNSLGSTRAYRPEAGISDVDIHREAVVPTGVSYESTYLLQKK